MRLIHRKKSNLISYAWEPHLHERTPQNMRDSGTEIQNELYTVEPAKCGNWSTNPQTVENWHVILQIVLYICSSTFLEHSF